MIRYAEQGFGVLIRFRFIWKNTKCIYLRCTQQISLRIYCFYSASNKLCSLQSFVCYGLLSMILYGHTSSEHLLNLHFNGDTILF